MSSQTFVLWGQFLSVSATELLNKTTSNVIDIIDVKCLLRVELYEFTSIRFTTT